MSPVKAVRAWWLRVTDPPPGWDGSMDELSRWKRQIKFERERAGRNRRANRRWLSPGDGS